MLMAMLPGTRVVRVNESGNIIMSKHSNFVSVSVDPCAKKKLAHASKTVAELANAFILGSDDTGTKPSRRR
jgi:hypothetical protein